MGILREPKVFVVDGDASVRVALQRLIRSGGFVVETFASGEQLLENVALGQLGMFDCRGACRDD